MLRIVLASASESRRKLLSAAGLTFSVLPSGVDESELASKIAEPRRLAGALARAKAIAVAARESDSIVIGSDQTLELDGALITKASSRDEARNRLAAFAGRTHKLHSAFSIANGRKELARGCRTARLTMRPLRAGDIDSYLDEAGDAILSSVGCYHLEGLGVRLFDRVDGDFFTVLGLPMIPLLRSLRRLGALT